MANIIINKDSHLAKTNRLITLDADDVYAFNRSISGLNQSIYGIQPSKDQILNGIDIEDISSNNSLCSDVYFLDKNFDKLKYFAQKSFIICNSYEDVLSTATNPLAIYLTPISSDGFITDVKNNSGKRIFSKLKLMEELSKIKSVDEKDNLWKDIKQFLIENNYWTTVELAIYLEEDNVLFKSIIDTLLDDEKGFKNKYSLSKEKIENTLDKCGYDAFSGINDYYEYIFIFKEEVNWDELKTYTEGKIYLSNLIEEGKGKFELIGSTSLTDEKFSKLFSDIYTKCNEIEDNLSENLSETKNDVNKISGDFKNHLNEYNEFSNYINNKVDNKLEISDLTEENLKNKTDENNDNKKIYGRLDAEKNYWSGQQTFLSNLNIARKINNQNTQIGDITTGTNSLKIFSKNGNSLDIGADNVNNEKKTFDLKIGNNFSFDKTYDKKTNTLLKIEEDKISSSVPVFSEYLNSKDLYTKRILGTEYIGSESKDDLIKLSPNKISVDNNAEVCVNNLSSTHIFANDITLDGNSVGEMRAIHLKDIVIDGKIVLGNHTNGIVDSAGNLNNNEVNLNFGKPIYFLNLDNSSKTSIYGNLSIKGEMCPLYVDGGKAIFGNYTQSIYHILNTSDSDKEFQIHFENIESTGGVANIRILYSENNLKKVEINENGESSSYYVDTLKHIIKPNQCFSFKISISYVGGYFLVKYEPILDSDKYVRADYNYAGRPQYIDCKVTDNVYFTGNAGNPIRLKSAFVEGKLLTTYVTGYGNASGHLFLEGSGKETYGITLRTAGGAKNSIEINPGSSTTIKGDLNIASRAAVTTGDYQKTQSNGDINADGTVKSSGLKVVDENNSDIFVVDNNGLNLNKNIDIFAGNLKINEKVNDNVDKYVKVFSDKIVYGTVTKTDNGDDDKFVTLNYDDIGDKSLITSHINDKNNPHNVTASQIGTYTSAEIDSISSYIWNGWVRDLTTEVTRLDGSDSELNSRLESVNNNINEEINNIKANINESYVESKTGVDIKDRRYVRLTDNNTQTISGSITLTKNEFTQQTYDDFIVENTISSTFNGPVGFNDIVQFNDYLYCVNQANFNNGLDVMYGNLSVSNGDFYIGGKNGIFCASPDDTLNFNNNINLRDHSIESGGDTTLFYPYNKFVIKPNPGLSGESSLSGKSTTVIDSNTYLLKDVYIRDIKPKTDGDPLIYKLFIEGGELKISGVPRSDFDESTMNTLVNG